MCDKDLFPISNLLLLYKAQKVGSIGLHFSPR